MMRFTNAACVAGFLAMTLVGSSSLAEPVRVTAKYQPVSGGYRYYLTMYNDTDSQTNYHVWALDVLLPGGSDLEFPPKWDYTDILDWEVHWAINHGMDKWGNWRDGIPPGESLSGFNVTTPTLVDEFVYRASVFNAAGGTAYAGYAYPEFIPEPSSLLVLATGLAAAPFWLRRRRGK